MGDDCDVTEVRLEVYDADMTHEGDFLGVVVLPWRELMKPGQRDRVTLESDFSRAKESATGTLTFRVAHQAKVLVHVQEAFGLKALDLTGGSDPYCKLEFLGEIQASVLQEHLEKVLEKCDAHLAELQAQEEEAARTGVTPARLLPERGAAGSSAASAIAGVPS